ncbi:unnamed protein product [Withania somnifera]
MTQENGELHVVFLPYFTPSHMTPIVDIARHFASHGVKVSIITTYYNALLFNDFSAVIASEMTLGVCMGIDLLQKPIEDLIVKLRPHCIVSDVCLMWTVDVAEQLKIPTLTFVPHNRMYHCVEHCLNVYTPHDKVSSDTESYLIPGLPDKIEMRRPQYYGVIHNSIYDLESTYAELYQKIKGKKPWLIGPLFHFSKREEASNSRNTAVQERHSCLSWLDSQEPNSVMYICFESMGRFSDAQLTETALAIEASNSYGWMPQLKILNHPATTAFMTHCGWNSTLESLTTGVPMLTWPLFAEQFYNEKLVEVLGCGVAVGAEVWHKEKTETSVKMLMNASRDGEKIRSRAKDIKAMVKRAVEKGGSSYNHLIALIQEIKCHAWAYQKSNRRFNILSTHIS